MPSNNALGYFKRDTIEQSIGDRLFEQVAAGGERVAVWDDHEQLTYAALGERVDALASCLRAQCSAERAPLAVLAGQSAGGVVAVLAALRAGLAYLPLNVHMPEARLRAIVVEAGPVGVLHDEEHAALAARIEPDADRRLAIEPRLTQEASAHRRSAHDVMPDDLASVLYTSGSTGEARGVCQTHRNVLHHIANYTDAIRIQPNDRLTLLAPLAFAASVTNLLGALLNGATLCVFDVRRHGTAPLARWLRAREITVYHSVPTLWRQVGREAAADGPLERLRIVRLGGEPVTRADVELAARCTRPGARMYLALSTTETHTVCHTLIDPHARGAGDPLSAGRPPQGVEVVLLDEADRTVKHGEPGRIVVRGRHIARGYWRRPDLTQGAFADVPGDTGVRQFDTGDVGRWLPDGSLMHLGRRDGLVKVHGQRVALVEVEAALARQPGVREAAVTAQRDEHDSVRLIGYVVGESQATLNPHEVRASLATELPEHMTPHTVVVLERLPIGPTGKVNRAALPHVDTATVHADRAYVAPVSDAERSVAAIFAQALRVERVGRVGRDDDLFDLGGQSLSAMAIASRASTVFGIDVPLHLVFDHATPASLAKAIEALRRGAEASTNSAEPTPAGQQPVISLAQQRLWFLEKLEPGTTTHHLGTAIRFTGPLDVDRLEAAVARIVARHETLRCAIDTRDGQPVLRLVDKVPVDLSVLDISGEAEGGGDECIARHVQQLAAAPFVLSDAPLWRARLLRLGPSEHVLAWAVHHQVWDAWSADLFLDELKSAYSAPDAPLPALVWRYQDYAADQRRRIAAPDFAAHLDYWRSALADVPTHVLPAARAGRASSGHASCLLNDAQSATMDALCRQHRVTPFMLTLAALAVVLARRAGQDDVVIGTPVADRADQRARPLIGLLLNMLPLRVKLDGQASFVQLLAHVRRTVVEAGAHALVPFERIIDALALLRDTTRTPLFDVVLNAPLRRDKTSAMGEVHVDSRRIDVGPPVNALTVYLRRRDGRFQLDAAFRTQRFDDVTVATLLKQVRGVLLQAGERADVPCGRMSLVTESDHARLPDPSAELVRGEAVTLHELVTRQAQRAPDRIAIVTSQRRWTFSEVERQSNRIAQWLISHDLAGGDAVIIRGRRDGQLVCAMLGVLKAGGAFIVSDPAHPDAWAAHTAARTKARTAIDLGASDASSVPWPGGCAIEHRLTLGHHGAGGRDVLADVPDGPVDVHVDADGPACIAFTSGTTAEPRGIITAHRPVAHFLQWHIRRFSLTANDRFSMLSGLGHDPLLRDIFTPLTLGATLCVPDADALRDPARLHAWLLEQGVTVAHLTPSLGRMLSAMPATSSRGAGATLALRCAFFGGEALVIGDVRAMRRRAPSVTCVNFYGATETPQAVAYHVVDPQGDVPDDAAVPLGRGIEAAQLLVVNPAGELAGVGERGIIHVRTPHLSVGYVGDQALTQARFITNRWTGDADDRLYVTGDAGWYEPDGSVMYAGRDDRQVKVRGHRIEPAQIEACLASHPQVAGSAVDVRPAASGLMLVGFVAGAAGMSLDDIRRHAAKLLPGPMCPARLYRVDALPLTSRGKVDYRALAALTLDGPAVEASAEPRTDTQRALADIWRTTLELPAVGIHDSFFDIGGDSLLAVRLFARIEQRFGRSLPLATLFARPTIAALAEALDAASAEGGSSVMPVRPQGDRPPLFCVHGIGGDLLFLQPLLEHLPNDQPVFGFQAHGIAGDGQPDTRIDAMAHRYMHDLLAAFPHGPYHLAGYSSGGVIALEMATQLRDAGHEVPVVMIIDNVAPGTRRQRPLWSPVSLARIAANLPRWLADDLLHTPPKRTMLRAWGRVRSLARRMGNRISRRETGRALDTEALFGVSHMPERRRRFYQVQYEALRAHRPRPYDGRVVIFRARTRPLWRTGEPDLGWGPIVRGPMEVIDLSGTHATILTGRTGRALAGHITRVLDGPTPAR